MRATAKAGDAGTPAICVTLEPCSHLSAVTLLRAPGGAERASQAGFGDLLVCDSLCLNCEVGSKRANIDPALNKPAHRACVQNLHHHCCHEYCSWSCTQSKKRPLTLPACSISAYSLKAAHALGLAHNYDVHMSSACKQPPCSACCCAGALAGECGDQQPCPAVLQGGLPPPVGLQAGREAPVCCLAVPAVHAPLSLASPPSLNPKPSPGAFGSSRRSLHNREHAVLEACLLPQGHVLRA